MTLEELVSELERSAEDFEAHACTQVAATKREDARLLREWWNEPLGLESAAEERGVSVRTLERWLQTGKVRAMRGTPERMVRRCDLYRPGEPEDEDARREADKVIAGRF